MAHLSRSQRPPVRKSLSPSRRHCLHDGSVFLAMETPLHPSSLLGTAAVVGLRRLIGDAGYFQTVGLQGPDGRLTSRTRALHEHVHLFHAEFLGGLLGSV